MATVGNWNTDDISDFLREPTKPFSSGWGGIYEFEFSMGWFQLASEMSSSKVAIRVLWKTATTPTSTGWKMLS